MLPVYVEGHVHTLGAEQVPLFKQVGLHTGVWHTLPVYVEGHVHTLGAEQVPLFKQVELHTGV